MVVAVASSLATDDFDLNSFEFVSVEHSSLPDLGRNSFVVLIPTQYLNVSYDEAEHPQQLYDFEYVVGERRCESFCFCYFLLG